MLYSYVEFVTHGLHQRVNFLIPRVYRDYGENSLVRAAKRELEYQVDRSSAEDKLRGFLEKGQHVQNTVCHQAYLGEEFPRLAELIALMEVWIVLSQLLTLALNMYVLLFDGEVGAWENESGNGGGAHSLRWAVYNILGISHFVNSVFLTLPEFAGKVPTLAKRDFAASCSTTATGWRRLLNLEFVLGVVQTGLKRAMPHLGPFVFPFFILLTKPDCVYYCAYIAFSVLGWLTHRPYVSASHTVFSRARERARGMACVSLLVCDARL